MLRGSQLRGGVTNPCLRVVLRHPRDFVTESVLSGFLDMFTQRAFELCPLQTCRMWNFET